MAVRKPQPESPAAAARSHRPASSWRWAGVLSVTLLLLTLPPIAIAALRAPHGAQFSGYVVIGRDAYVYQAIWREGFRGAWLFHSPYTTESLPGVLLYPWYLWTGHLIGWASGPWLYHLARVAAAGALLIALWRLVCELFRPGVLRRWAFLLSSLGGGIGIFLPQLQIGPLVTHATEMRSPGSSVADLIAMAPHLPWAMALMCWAMVVGLRCRRLLRQSELISGLVALLGLQLIYPQLALLAVLVIAAWAGIRRDRRPLWFAVAGGLLQLPYLVYLAWLSRSTPQALAIVRPSLDVGDPFGFLVLSHLVATALILFAIARGRIRGDLLLPALWIAGMTLFMFLPGISGTLGRSFMASSIPFGLCATVGLLALLRTMRGARWRRRVVTLTLAASSLYGIFSLAQPLWIAGFRLDARAEYERGAEATLLQRLAPVATSRDVVLTTYLDGVFVPAQTDARAFVGHPDMTIDAGVKSAEANAYLRSWSAEQRRQFTNANGIDYVLAPDADAVARLANDPGLRLIDRSGDAALFAVTP